MAKSITPSNNSFALEDLLDEWHALPRSRRLERFKGLELHEAQRFYLYLPSLDQSEMMADMAPEERQIWIRLLAPDDAAAVLRECSGETKAHLLSLIDDKTRAEVAAILSYDEDSAGGLMSMQYLRVRPEMTAGEALEYVRRQMRQHVKLMRYGYVLDEESHLVGVVSVRSLLTSDPRTPVRDLMSDNSTFVIDSMTTEQMRATFEKYSFTGLPVVDSMRRMKGIVTVDDVIDVIREEATEDIHKLGGSETLDGPYLQVGFFPMIRKRAGWLCVLFIGEMFTATAMGHFEEEISRAVVLALFIPLIISSGGNSGSQASTLIVRAIALGEVKLRDWWRVFFKEIASGLTLGLILGSIGLVRILMWPNREKLYGEHYVLIAYTVAISLVGVVLWGSLSGSMLPFVLKKLGFDPATASAPFVATLVDVTGLVIYFTVAQFFLRGYLL